jgi:Domain of Unknown Function with PDB structure (DUF3861)
MGKRGHRFLITVAPADADTGPGIAAEQLTFVHVSHDDIIRIVEKVRGLGTLDEDASAAVVLGTKLLASVMIAQKNNPLFAPLRDSLPAFIQQLKSAATVDR